MVLAVTGRRDRKKLKVEQSVPRSEGDNQKKKAEAEV